MFTLFKTKGREKKLVKMLYKSAVLIDIIRKTNQEYWELINEIKKSQQTLSENFYADLETMRTRSPELFNNIFDDTSLSNLEKLKN